MSKTDPKSSTPLFSIVNELVIRKEDMDELVKFAKDCEPNECAAMLLGTFSDQKAITEQIFYMRKSNVSPASVEMNDMEILEAYQKAEELNMEIVGVFHSHPQFAPRPSNTDWTYMKTNQVPWIIYSNIQNNWKTWVLMNENSVSINTKIVED